MFIRTGVHNWLNTDHIAQIIWYPEEHEFIVKWTTGLSIAVSEEPGVRALEELLHSEPHEVPAGLDYLWPISGTRRGHYFSSRWPKPARRVDPAWNSPIPWPSSVTPASPTFRSLRISMD